MVRLNATKLLGLVVLLAIALVLPSVLPTPEASKEAQHIGLMPTGAVLEGDTVASHTC